MMKASLRRACAVATISVSFALGLAVSSSCQPQTPEVKRDSTQLGTQSSLATYRDEKGYFEVSFPREYKIVLKASESTDPGKLAELKKIVPIETQGVVFFAGMPVYYGYNPYILVRALDLSHLGTSDIHSVDFTGKFASGDTLSRENTVVNGRKAVIFLRRETLGDSKLVTMTIYDYVLITQQSNTYGWMVSCTVWYANDFSGYKDTFDTIVRSFRMLK